MKVLRCAAMSNGLGVALLLIIPLLPACAIECQEACPGTGGSAALLQIRAVRDLAGGPSEKIEKFLVSNFSKGEPYQLSHGTKDFYGQHRQDERLWPTLSQISDGFFVESGAYDGEWLSNTLAYEQRLGWTGLLVEPWPQNFVKLKTKRRKAVLFQGALSTSTRIEMQQFQNKDSRCGAACAGAQDYMQEKFKHAAGNIITVVGVPLDVLLSRLNRTTVDFWSLDVEGAEAAVLHSTDFSKFEVGVLLIEMNKGEENNAGVEEVMQREGFQKVGTTALDGIYVNPRYFEARKLLVPAQI